MSISHQMRDYLTRGSKIRRLFEDGQRLKQDGSGLPVTDLSLGNPTLEPPAMFKSALQTAARDDSPGRHRYMHNAGFPETRAAVADAMQVDHQLPMSADHIVMTTGAAAAVNIALKALLDPGDEVIVVAPYFVEYGFYVANHGGKTVVVNSAPDFNLNVAAIAAAIGVRTRMIIINNPNNPTGVVYPQNTLNALAAMLRQANAQRDQPIYLLDDAPYRKLVYTEGPCPSIFKAYPHSLMATSFSKDLSLPGERIGFLAISPQNENGAELWQAACFAGRILGFVNAPALMQRVCTKLQQQSADIDWYRCRRDKLLVALQRRGYNVARPDGAFYLFVKIPDGYEEAAFIDKLKSHRLLAVPGSAFGTPGYFRIAYCQEMDTIDRAVEILDQMVK